LLPQMIIDEPAVVDELILSSEAAIRVKPASNDL
jgi:hypothetical protein